MNIKKRLEAGVAAHRKGKLKQAADAYRAVLKAEPENADALHFAGMLAHSGHDNEQAVELISRSLKIFPSNAAAANNLGNILLLMSRPQDAARAYGQAIEADPRLPDPCRNLGVLLRRIGQLEKATQTLRRAAELEPENPIGWHNLGVCYILRKDYEQAADAFETCTRLGIHDRLNAVWHAKILCSMGREEAALAHFERALERHPDDPICLHHAAAIRGETTDRASESYVRDMFNTFASTFDDTLEALDYRAPELVAEDLALWQNARPPSPVGVDLGCGTGRCGPLVSPHCQVLIGVDLAPQMLYKAARVGAYHELHERDLVAFLNERGEASVDWAVSADTLNYLGDLSPLMAATCRALRPGGVLVATIEEGEPTDGTSDYVLQNHGRYSHATAYVHDIAEKAGLRVLRERREILRREVGEDVGGIIMTIGRPG